MRNTTKLKAIANRRAATIMPGTPNPLIARVIADLGFECAYVTGAGVANMNFGLPDIGMTSLTDVADSVAKIADVVDIPLLVDADTGFGNVLNIYRSVQVLERCGAAAIQFEDQVFPKRCGHFEGKSVVPAGEMVDKLHAAVDARKDQDLMIVARTDVLAIEGIDAALDRAAAYTEAGADMTFVEAPTNAEDLGRIARELSVPQVANIVFGGKTPNPGQQCLADAGFGFSLFANAALQAAMGATYDVLSALKDDGALDKVKDKLLSFERRQALVSKDVWDAREAQYSDNSSTD